MGCETREHHVSRRPDDRRRGLEHVGELVDGVVASLGGREGLGTSALLFAEWSDIAGPDWAQATPIRVSEGVLTVAVADGITATTLRYETAELIARVERRFGPGVVAAVRLKVARPRGHRR